MPSSTVTGTATATLSQAQVDAGSVVNIATGTGTPPIGSDVSDDDTNTVPIEQDPSIQDVKAKGEVGDLDGNGDDDGDHIVYHYAVTNDGNVTLYNVHLSDDQLGSVSLSGLTDQDGDGSADDLAVGATVTGTATATLSQAQVDAGSVVNIATGTGTPPIGSDVSDDDTNTVPIEQDP